MMRTAAGSLVLTLALSSAQAQAPTRVAQPSTRASVTVNLSAPQGVQGVTPVKISIDYGQPHLRGRKLHTADLVPLDSVWRLGANEATVLDTPVDLVIGGHRLTAGKYSLYALPRASGWQLIINANTGQWGTEYVLARDVARVNLTKRTLAAPVEAFSMWMVPSRAAGAPAGELKFAWGDVELTTEWRVP